MIIWDDLRHIDNFLLCIPLKSGAIVVGLLGLAYGFIGVFYLISMCVNFFEWKSLYIHKLDLLTYLFFIFALMTLVFVASILLLVGVFGDFHDLVIVYLWCGFAHVGINLVLTLAVIIYCMFINTSCFQYSGPGQAVTTVVFSVIFTGVCSYILVVVNSYRMEM